MDKQVANVDLIGINKALKIELKEEPLLTCLVVVDISPLAETVDQELVLVDQEPELEDQDQVEPVDQVAQVDQDQEVQDQEVQVALKLVDQDLEDQELMLVVVALLKVEAPAAVALAVEVNPAVVVNPVDLAVALVNQEAEESLEALAVVVNLVDLDQEDQVVEVNQLQNNHQAAVVAPTNLPVEVEVMNPQHLPQLHLTESNESKKYYQTFSR